MDKVEAVPELVAVAGTHGGTTFHRFAGASTLILTLALPAGAQGRVVRVAGLAYDSLRGIPLKDAQVAILGVSSSATTDDRGRFSFDQVPTGAHTFVVQHPVLDSLGFSGLSRRIMVTDGEGLVNLGLPSFPTLWRMVCGAGTPPRDSGFVFGTIRSVVDGKPVPNAYVDVTWTQVTYQKSVGLRQRAHRGATRSDSAGAYFVCGVPTLSWLRVDAAVAQGASGRIDMPPASLKVQRRDLLLGKTGDVDSTMRGTISGHVTDHEGGPMLGARIILDDSTEVRSLPDGRFTIPGIAAGTRQVEVLALGSMPVVAAVDVLPGETSALAVQLRRVTTLDVVEVTASRRGRRIAAEIAERRQTGFARTMEIGELMAHASLGTAFGSFAGASVSRSGRDFTVYVSDGRGGQCAPHVYIDDARSDYFALNMLRPREVTAVELISRAGDVPIKYRPPELKAWCGVILVWTNWAFSH